MFAGADESGSVEDVLAGYRSLAPKAREGVSVLAAVDDRIACVVGVACLTRYEAWPIAGAVVAGAVAAVVTDDTLSTSNTSTSGDAPKARAMNEWDEVNRPRRAPAVGYCTPVRSSMGRKITQAATVE